MNAKKNILPPCRASFKRIKALAYFNLIFISIGFSQNAIQNSTLYPSFINQHLNLIEYNNSVLIDRIYKKWTSMSENFIVARNNKVF